MKKWKAICLPNDGSWPHNRIKAEENKNKTEQFPWSDFYISKVAAGRLCPRVFSLLQWNELRYTKMLFRRRHFPLNRKIYEDNSWVILLIKLVLSRFYVASLTSLFHMHRPATLFPFLFENTWRHGFRLSGVKFKVLNTGASFLSKISHMSNLASFRSNVPMSQNRSHKLQPVGKETGNRVIVQFFR